MKLRVFIDSDVVISSLISSTGAAHALLTETPNLERTISNLSSQELKEVCKRMQLDALTLLKTVEQQLHVIHLKTSHSALKKSHAQFVADTNDSHIIAGAESSKSKFLITYNLKHFRVEKIKAELNIIVLTPANFLQYLRSIKIV